MVGHFGHAITVNSAMIVNVFSVKYGFIRKQG
jgi:hypothetical protein